MICHRDLCHLYHLAQLRPKTFLAWRRTESGGIFENGTVSRLTLTVEREREQGRSNPKQGILKLLLEMNVGLFF